MFEVINFNLEVENLNDNIPSFESDFTKVTFFENQPIGTQIEIPELVAFDADLPDGKLLKYSITPNNLFDVENKDGRTFLVSNQVLDREEAGFYTGNLVTYKYILKTGVKKANYEIFR